MHSCNYVNLSLLLGLGLLTTLIIAFQLTIYRKTQFTLSAILTNQNLNYQEIESLFSIFSILKIRAPLPPMRGWTVSPDFANTLISQILENRPKIILELGSGLSTLVSAYCLEEIGQGKIISIDHEKEYATKTLEALSTHKLREFVEIRYAPLTKISLDKEEWHWYDMSAFTEIQCVDLLVIDGPPADFGSMVRYPALPLLDHLLSDNAVILVDDANRVGESKMVEKWLKQFSNMHLEFVSNEKGIFILKKVPLKIVTASKVVEAG